MGGEGGRVCGRRRRRGREEGCTILLESNNVRRFIWSNGPKIASAGELWLLLQDSRHPG